MTAHAAGDAAPAIVITGASTGIGRACALHLDSIGWRVFAGVRKEEDAQSLRSAASDRLTPIMLDVTDADQISAAAATIAEALGDGPLHGLVNNAGIVVAAPVEVVPIEALRRQLEVNTIGAVAVIQAFLPLLRRARGRIINISSISGRIAFPVLGPYAASKFALGALSDALRVELADSGITVTCLEPGSVATPIWEKSIDAAEAMADRLTLDDLKRYGPMMHAARASAAGKSETAMPVQIIVDRVMKALSSPKPKAHDIIGRSSRRSYWVVKFIPWRLRDRLFAKGLKQMIERSAADG